MRMIISGEQPFSVLGHSFMVSPSKEQYTLSYSANGVDYTDYEEATPANENLSVYDIPSSCYFKLKGNKSDVVVSY